MNKIPAEVLQKVFLLLHQHDKAECMTVCRSWKSAIEDSVLFNTVCLYNKEQFDSFISKCRRDLRLSENIGRLIVEMEHMESAQMDLLPFVILNVRELYFYENTEQYDLQFTKTLSPHPWSNTIRIIKEESSNIFTTHILNGGVCPALTEIAIHKAGAPLGKEFIELLVNSPELKSLSLTSCSLSLEELNLIHNNAPLLSSLSMYGVEIDCTYLPNTKPVACVSKLIMERINITTYSAYIYLQKYLTMKYPKVTEMIYNVIVKNIGYHPQNNWRPTGNVFGSSSGVGFGAPSSSGFGTPSNLDFGAPSNLGFAISPGFGYPSNPVSSSNFFSYDIYGSNTEEAGLAYQIKQIGSHLTSLKIGYQKPFTYIFKVLDNNGCHIKEFNIGSSAGAYEVDQLAKSQQGRCIQSLSLGNISTENFISYIGGLTALTELNLNCGTTLGQGEKITINIKNLLKSVGGNLITLRISLARIVFDSLSVIQYPSLKYLELSKTTIARRTDHFILQSFPKLRSLILDSISDIESTSYLVDLNLAYLEVRAEIPLTNPYVLVMTVSDSKKRWYSTKPVCKHRKTTIADPTVFPAVKSFPADKYNSLPYLTFVCNSLNNFFLVNLIDSQS